MAQPGQALHHHNYYVVGASPGKGNGSFAIRDIPKGTTILSETALFSVPLSEHLITLNFVATAYSSLTPAQKQLYSSLPFFMAPSFAGSNLLAKFQCNKMREDDTNSYGCYAHASRFNHSCLPNCVLITNGPGLQDIKTVRNTAQDEELTITYGEHLLFMTYEQRQQQDVMGPLLNQACSCNLCTAPRSERHIHDLRRNLLRHLFFFVKGQDLALNQPMIPNGFRAKLVDLCGNCGYLRARRILLGLAIAEGIDYVPKICDLGRELHVFRDTGRLLT